MCISGHQGGHRRVYIYHALNRSVLLKPCDAITISISRRCRAYAEAQAFYNQAQVSRISYPEFAHITLNRRRPILRISCATYFTRLDSHCHCSSFHRQIAPRIYATQVAQHHSCWAEFVHMCSIWLVGSWTSPRLMLPTKPRLQRPSALDDYSPQNISSDPPQRTSFPDLWTQSRVKGRKILLIGEHHVGTLLPR